MEELPFMATETILMDAVKAGGDRQELHERIRIHSMQAASLVKEEGKRNDLLERIAADPAFPQSLEDLYTIMEPSVFIGRSIQQVEEYNTEYILPMLEKEKASLGMNTSICV